MMILHGTKIIAKVKVEHDKFWDNFLYHVIERNKRRLPYPLMNQNTLQLEVVVFNYFG